MILAGSTVQENGDIDQQLGICLRTAWKWLNCLGYKWKEVQKEVFFDGHERKDVIESWETFLNKIKSLLPYLVEFSKDGTMVSKKYSSNCAVGEPGKRPVIMITHDKSIFFANNGRKKVWTLNGQGILRLKGKKEEIIVSIFLLP